MATAAKAEIGHNSNAMTPFETFTVHITDLMETAQGFLDGEPVTTQALADDIGKLLDECRTASKDADKARATEKKPHDDAAKAVQEKWKPLIAKCELAADVAKKALAPFLAAEQAKREAEATEARRIADEAAAAARKAMQEAAEADLAKRAEAEALLAEAEKADKAANKAGKERASVGGGARAVTLRTVWSAEIVDRRTALNAYLKTNPDAFVDVIQSLANHEARHGPRTTPGINFQSEQVPV